MRLLFGAGALAVLLGGTALAQEVTTPAAPAANIQVPPSRCGELPAAPTPPDGATANADTMQTAMAAFQTWEASYREAIQCRRTEAQEAQAASQRRTDEYNAGVQSFNGSVAAWTTAVETYNARQPARRRR